MNHNKIHTSDQLEQILFDFEQSWQNDHTTKIEDFAPSQESSNHIEVLTELVRSEMEFRSEAGEPFHADHYFERFPGLETDDDAKQAIVFEEYRLRRTRGDSVTAESLRERYGIKSTQWPSIGPQISGSNRPTPTPGSGSRKKPKFPSVGETVGDFELVGQLGEGAFGKVFLAQQGELEKRLVVLKFTTARTDEHRLLARLQHTNIVPIHSVHRFGELQAICMPLLGVATLSDILQFFGKKGSDRTSQHSHALIQTVNQHRESTVRATIPNEDIARHFVSRQQLTEYVANRKSSPSLQKFAATFISKMAEGLGYAHQRGIVHGDLKPANVLVDDDGDPVILDFHLGSCTGDDVGQLIGGTLPYMAPEHLQAMSQNDLRLMPTMDIYSTGVILYELLTGSIPFDNDLKSTFSVHDLAQAKNRPFVIDSKQRHQIGKDLTAIVQTCLDPVPTKRFANGTELAQELQRAIEHRPLQRASNGTASHRIAKWSKRHPRLSSASTILAVSTLIIAGIATALFFANSRLNKLNAIAESRQNIERADSLRTSLATEFGFHDSSFIESGIENAAVFAENTSLDLRTNYEKEPRFARLDPADSDAESMAAAELHFWIAEVNRRIGERDNDQERIDAAQVHNRTANALWPPGKSKVAIDYQNALLTSYANGTTLDVDQISVLGTPDNHRDRILAVRYRNKNLSARVEQYRQLAMENKDDFLAWLLLANACKSQGNLEQAESYYTVCASIDPTASQPLCYRAMVRMEQNKFEGSLKDFERADRLTPDDITILLNHALALGKSRKFDQALVKYDRAIELGARQTRAWFRRSQLKKALGDNEGAKQDFEKFMSMEPTDEKSWIVRGSQKRAKDPHAAIDDYKNALRYDPQSLAACVNIAHIYAEVLGDTPTAIEYMNRAVEIDMFNAKQLAARGVLHSRIGNSKKAIADANAALDLDRSADIKYRVAGIYAQLSRLNEAYAERANQLLAQAAMQDPQLVLKLNAEDPDLEPIEDHEDFGAVFEAISSLKSVSNNNSETK